jgi:hypothetical protein
MNHQHYVPVLTGKSGEVVAISHLPASIRSGLTPLLDMPPIPEQPKRDGKESPPPSPVDKLNNLFKRLEAKWDADRDVLIDLDGYEQYRPRKQHPVEFVAARTHGRSLRLELVVSNLSSQEYLAAAEATADKWDAGFCLRIHAQPGQEPAATAAEIDRVRAELGRAPESLDLLIDLGRLEGYSGDHAELARAHLSAVPESNRWRGRALAATSVPEEPKIPQGGEDRFRRGEWTLWRQLRREHKIDFAFADYSVTGPRATDDSFKGRPAPHLRYTTEKALLWWRGHYDDTELELDEVRLRYPDLCRKAVQHPDCKRADYSWGDSKITEKARHSSPRPGSPTTWVEHASNHHLTLVVNSVRGLGGV